MTRRPHQSRIKSGQRIAACRSNLRRGKGRPVKVNLMKLMQNAAKRKEAGQ